MKNFLRYLSGALVSFILIAQFLSCATTGPGGKKSLILISSEQESSIGRQIDTELRQTEKVLPDTLWQSYISSIGNRLVAVSDRKDIEYHFAVIESDQVNAFATPGGYIYFYTGLIREMDSEAELAAVMAHEMSHVVGRHGIKRLQSVMGLQIVLDLAVGRSSETTKGLVGAALGVILAGYSRSQEAEADEFGIAYMTQAGWNPQGAVTMFEKLAKMSGGQEQGFFEQLSSSHPETQSRISAAKKQVAGISSAQTKLVLDTRKYQEMKKRLPAKTSGKK